MLSSSFEYFKALHDDDYLLFLQWPQFIEQHYRQGKDKLSADDLLDCLVYEWLIQNSVYQDVDKIALLYAVYELEPSPLQAGAYAFPLCSILSALFFTLAIYAHGLQNIIVPNEEISKKDIADCIVKKTQQVEAEVFHRSISLMRDEFMKYIPQLEKNKIHHLGKQIKQLLAPINLISNYLERLISAPERERRHTFYGTRLGLVQSMLAYLRQQTRMSTEVGEQLTSYISAIRCQQPAGWEDEYLNEIAPSTLPEKAWSTLAALGPRFFTLLGTQEETKPGAQKNTVQP